MDPLDQVESSSKNQYGVLKLQPQSPLDSATGTSGQQHFSFANPVYEPSGGNPASGGPTYKVEDVVIRMRNSSSSGSYRRASTAKAWGAIRSMYATKMCMSQIVLYSFFFCIYIVGCEFNILYYLFISLF